MVIVIVMVITHTITITSIVLIVMVIVIVIVMVVVIVRACILYQALYARDALPGPRRFVMFRRGSSSVRLVFLYFLRTSSSFFDFRAPFQYFLTVG